MTETGRNRVEKAEGGRRKAIISLLIMGNGVGWVVSVKRIGLFKQWEQKGKQILSGCLDEMRRRFIPRVEVLYLCSGKYFFEVIL